MSASLDPADLPPPPEPGQPAPAITGPDPALARVLAQRRSSKPFHLVDPAPTRAQLEAILRLATRVPDHGKLAPWRFVVFTGDAGVRAGEALAAIAARLPGASEPTIDAARAMFTRSACVVMVVSTAAPHAKIPEWEQQLSAGAVTLNLLLAAQAFGFGAVWLTGWAAYDAAAGEVLGLAAHERVVGFVHIGTQTQAAEERPRPDVRALTTWF